MPCKALHVLRASRFQVGYGSKSLVHRLLGQRALNTCESLHSGQQIGTEVHEQAAGRHAAGRSQRYQTETWAKLLDSYNLINMH